MKRSQMIQFPASRCRQDQARHVLPPGRVMQQSLGQRVPAADRAGDQQTPYILGAGRAAGFAGQRDRDALPFQPVRQQAGLSRFAGPLPAFERDELAPRSQRTQFGLSAGGATLRAALDGGTGFAGVLSAGLSAAAGASAVSCGASGLPPSI